MPEVTVGVFEPEPIKLTARTLLPTVKLLVVLSNVKLELAPKLPPSLNCNCVLEPETAPPPVIVIVATLPTLLAVTPEPTKLIVFAVASTLVPSS